MMAGYFPIGFVKWRGIPAPATSPDVSGATEGRPLETAGMDGVRVAFQPSQRDDGTCREPMRNIWGQTITYHLRHNLHRS
jgi:hypothetical protein